MSTQKNIADGTVPKFNTTFKIPTKETKTSNEKPLNFLSPLNSVLTETDTKTQEKQSANKKYHAVKHKISANTKPSVAAPIPSSLSDRYTDANSLNLKRPSHTNDPALPDELNKLFQPLLCQLCNARVNSTLSAQTHYQSKNHEKKINNWLQDWSKRTGEPVPKRQRIKDSGPSGANSFHCDVCDIALSSMQHAQQHFTGKKHLAVLAGTGKPKGAGFYNAEGKWIKTPSFVSPGGFRFYGVGESTATTTPESVDVTTLHEKSTHPSVYCSICNVHVSRESQMKSHLEGAKHNKVVRALNQTSTLPPNSSKVVEKPAVKEIVLPKPDISIYRTPSGSFYCQNCDITLTTENLFNQHLNSKKHNKKSNTKEQN